MVITCCLSAKAFGPNTNKAQTPRSATRSPRSKSLGLTFLLYQVAMADLMATSVRALKFLHLSMKSSSSRVALTLALWSSEFVVLQPNSFTSTRITPKAVSRHNWKKKGTISSLSQCSGFFVLGKEVAR